MWDFYFLNTETERHGVILLSFLKIQRKTLFLRVSVF